jgi:hypothetical protein
MTRSFEASGYPDSHAITLKSIAGQRSIRRPVRTLLIKLARDFDEPPTVLRAMPVSPTVETAMAVLCHLLMSA